MGARPVIKKKAQGMRLGQLDSLLLQLLLDSLGHLGKCILDVGGGLGRSLQEDQVERGSEVSRLVVLDLTLADQIRFVTNKKLVDILAGIAVDFLQPLLNIVKRLLVGDIVDDDDTMGTTIVGRGNGTNKANNQRSARTKFHF